MSFAGACGNANVGISNDNECKTIHTENPRFPQLRQTSEGQSGAKGYPKGERDDDPVKIPEHAMQARQRPRSDTAAGGRNTPLKAVGES